MPTNDKSEVRGIQSVDRAMTLLMELSKVSRDIDLTELTRKTGLTKSTASRLLSTMQKRGLVRQSQATRRFSLGTEHIRLGNIALTQIWRPESFHAYLERLVQETGETASLAIRERNKVLYVDQVPSYNMIRSFPPIGTKVDLHCTAVGKVLLSGLTRIMVEQIIKTYGLVAHTPSTITDLAILFDVIDAVQKTGFGIECEETELGGCCLAAPVLDHDGKVIAAIGISGPVIRITPDKIKELSCFVKAAAAELSVEFGYKQN